MAYKNRIVGHGDEDPEQLAANPKNWRVHPHQQELALRGVLTEVGWVDTVLVNQRTGFVIDGHLRVAHALSQNEPTVPVTYVDLSEAEEALVLATLDPLTSLAATDAAQLDALLAGLAVDDQHLVQFLATLRSTEPKLLHEDDADLTPPAEPITNPGDLWLLGEHRLMCGDSTKTDDVTRLMDGRHADMLFTDPPYNVAVAGGSHDPRDEKNYGKGPRFVNDDSTDADYADFLHTAFEQAEGVMRYGAAFYVCCPGVNETQFRVALDKALRIRQCIIWVKHQFVFGRQDYHWRHESQLYGRNEGANHYFTDDKTQDTVWMIDRPMRSLKEHPTQKPIELITRALANSSRQREIVLDLFVGAGSTIIAAEQLGRRCYAMEIEPAYCDVSIKRWETVTGKKATLLKPVHADD